MNKSEQFKQASRLHEVISLAVEDVKACFADSSYSINMGFWHTPSTRRCEVCFAGSVMANRLDLPKNILVDDDYLSHAFGAETLNKFLTLNYIRQRRLFEIRPYFWNTADLEKWHCLHTLGVFDWFLSYDDDTSDDESKDTIRCDGEFSESTMQYFVQQMTRLAHELKALDL